MAVSDSRLYERSCRATIAKFIAFKSYRAMKGLQYQCPVMVIDEHLTTCTEFGNNVV
jgi:hypothetical protein